MSESIRMSDPRRPAVQHAVKVKALARLAREIGISEALAVVAAAMNIGGDDSEGTTPRELAAAGRLAHRATVIEEIRQLEKDGRGRSAALIVARRHAADVRDPIEVETLTNKFRRWRRAEERRARARLPSPGSTKP